MAVQERLRGLWEESGINPKFIVKAIFTPGGAEIHRVRRTPDGKRFEIADPTQKVEAIVDVEHYIQDGSGMLRRSDSSEEES